MTAAPLTLPAAELARRLRAADPSASLVRPRALRRVIKRHAGAAGFGTLVPHGHSYTLDGAAVLRYLDPADLGTAPGAPLPAKVILLERPDADALASRTPEQLLVSSWRRLFHARVHL